MSKPRIHRLRDRLWCLNGVLALVVAGVLWTTSSVGPLQGAHRDWDEEAASKRRPAVVPVRGRELREFLRVLRRFDPPGPAVAQRPMSKQTRLPLRGFEIAMVWHDDDQGYFIMLDSKDPSHDEKYFFEPGKGDRDAHVTSIRKDDRRLYASVARGEESFEFSTPLRSAGVIRSDVFRIHSPVGPFTGSQPVLASGRRPALKGVPYYESGRVVGLRVTGIRPGSWAVSMGIQRGDVIRKLDEDAISDPAAAKLRLRSDDRPQSIEVTRADSAGAKHISLSRG